MNTRAWLERAASILNIYSGRYGLLKREDEEDEAKWDAAFARSQDALEQLADEALAEYRRGETKAIPA